jgi:hypothetical protein
VSVSAVVWEVVVVPMECEFADSLQARLDSIVHVLNQLNIHCWRSVI